MKKPLAKALRLLALALMCVHAAYMAYLPARAIDALINRGVSDISFHHYAWRNSADEPLRDGFGIAFVGWPGLAWALTQALIVHASLVLFFSGKRQTRRFAWMALTAMSALWFGNILYFCIIGGFDFYWEALTAHGVGLFATIALKPR